MRRKIGSIIFCSLYVLGIVAFFIGLSSILTPLKDWLVRYEAAQPNYKRDEVFAQLFEKGDWESVYDLAKMQDTTFEDVDDFVIYMNNLTKGGELTCVETSAGLSGDKKFIVKLNDKKIATFLLTGGSKSQLEIAQWELSDVELFLTREASLVVQKLPGQTVYINGVALDDSYTIHRTTTLAEEYLPEGEHGYCLELQKVTGLWQIPDVQVKDEAGNAVALTYDEQSGIYTQTIPEMVLTDEQKLMAQDAAHSYCRYMINAADHKLWAYFNTECETYQEIIRFEQWTVQSYRGYDFSETKYDNFYQYSDNCFSVTVDMTLNVTRTNGSIKPYQLSSTLVFTKNADGKFLVTEMTNIDIQAKREQARLVFDQDGVQKVVWVDPANVKLELPAVTAPEGTTFKGWVTEEKTGEGELTLTIIFDAEGNLRLPADTTLKPMTLKPLFE